MAVVKRRQAPSVVKGKETKATKPVVAEETKAVAEETVEVKEAPKATKTTKVSKNPAPKAKAETKKAEVKKEVKEVKETKSMAKKETTKKAESKVKVIGKNPKAPVVKTVEIGEAGTLKRDELIFLFKERLKSEHNLELATLEDASRIIKTFESIIGEALTASNIVHLCGRNFNRKKVKARVFNPPIGDGAAYLVLPHYKMAYTLELSDKLKGSLNEEGNFVAEDGTVYTAEDIATLDAEFFGEE